MLQVHAERYSRCFFTVLLCIVAVLFTGKFANAQMDQGTIIGAVQDKTGAAVQNAEVSLTNTDTGLVLKTQSDTNGYFNFPPVKIGNYSVAASAPGFNKTIQSNVHLNIQQRLNLMLVLTPGSVSETVTVSDAPPLIQTQEGSIGQVISPVEINNAPLNGRNWVYIAQLTSGAPPATGGARGTGTGDFVSNGQRAEQNNFTLDGIDNNVNVIDFVNGQSYLVRPPPDAIAEFVLNSNAYSAEFGHSAGANLNASIKSGTNQLHGGLWEYFRNDVLNARDWTALPTARIPEYRQNQFGATLGFPVIKNKLFFFGDTEATRIVQGQPLTLTVPTTLMRQGDFSELLNTSLTGAAKPIQLYQPNSGGATTLSCNGANNVFCPSQINAVAQNILKLYPLPNANNGLTTNNYKFNNKVIDNTFQWDARADYNISAKDQMYSRFSYSHITGAIGFPLGPVLDGALTLASGTKKMLAESYMLSETHIFNPTLTNEVRVGYNYGNFKYLQANFSTSTAAMLGLGGVPPVTGQGYVFNGGLPRGNVSPLTSWGAGSYDPTIERQNVYQILDNVTTILGKHSLKFGMNIQSIRFATLQSPGDPRGGYTFSGLYTSNLGASNTGYGVADFLADQMSSSDLSTEILATDARWYRAIYAQDDWRMTSKLTVNIGLRYDYFQPYVEVGNRQANFLPTAPPGPGAGAAVFVLPRQAQNQYPLSAPFLALLAKDHVTVQYSSNRSLIDNQMTNFAPRLGFAYSFDPNTSIHGGAGVFYGALQSQGGATLSYNYPFQFTDNFPAPTCKVNNCPSNGITLENGYSAYISNLGNNIALPGLTGAGSQFKSPYTVSYNLEAEHAFRGNLGASVAYVGDQSRHLQSYINYNTVTVLLNPAVNSTPFTSFPDLGGGNFMLFEGMSDFNSLQARLQKHTSHGLSYLATYTWSHSLDDAKPLLENSTTGYRNPILIPLGYDYANSPFDVRHRVTFVGSYELPLGRGRAHLNSPGLTDVLVGGWSGSLIFTAQSGSPITVTPDISTAKGGTARAIRISDPFAAGGTPDVSNPGVTCAAKTRTLQHWYNPCAFANPLPGTNISASSSVTGTAAAISYLGGKPYQLTGPGLNQTSASLFKNFKSYHEQTAQLRVDAFNVFNTPAYGNPSISTNSSNGGTITGARTLQNFAPNARYFQFALKYQF